MTAKDVLSLSILCLILFLSLPAKAAVETAAKVVALRGQVTATSAEGISRRLKIKAPIYTTDKITTAKRGRLQIIFTDNTIISLGQNTTMVIKEYLWPPSHDDGALHTEIKEGIFRIMGGAITRVAPQKFTTQTPAATIGIRGSMYTGRVDGNSLSVVFQGGKGIVVSNSFGQVEIAAPGHGSHIQRGSPPPPPQPFSAAELATFEQDMDQPPPPPPPAEEEPPLIELPPPSETVGPETAEAETPPGDGISLFQGTINGTSTDINSGGEKPINDTMTIMANWHSKKIIGIADKSDAPEEEGTPVFFFGTINENLVTDVQIFGSGGGPSNQITATSGNGTGEFFGTSFTTFAMTGSGGSYEMAPSSTQDRVESWQVAGTGLAETDMLSPSASRGSAAWQGFVVGLAENVENIDDGSRKLFYNTTSNPFLLNINRDLGTISGNIITDSGDTNPASSGLAVGGIAGSAYIDDRFFVAILDSGSLKEHGNFLITAKKEDQMATYATWGYWEMAYTESTSQFHSHVPGSMWIAGQPTDNMVELTLPANQLSASYSGQVIADRIDTSVAAGIPQVTHHNGTLEMSVNFAEYTNTDSIQGSININSQNFAIHAQGLATTNPSFSGNLDGYSPGVINGNFYGHDAASTGGNFQAHENISTTYQGIFGGNR